MIYEIEPTLIIRIITVRYTNTHLAQPLECKELGYICRLDKPLLLFFPVFWW